MTKIDTPLGDFDNYDAAIKVCTVILSNTEEGNAVREMALDTLAEMGQRLDILMDDDKLDRGIAPDPDYLTTGLPYGYDTVLGYMAKHMPETIRYEAWDPELTQRHGFWLMHRAKERGITVVKVPAPPVLQDQGIETVNAYPVSLIRDRFVATAT